MIPSSTVITRLQTLGRTYIVEEAKDKEPVYQNVTSSHRIYVGYSGITSKDPTAPIEHDLYNLHGEDLVQSFDIQINCLHSNFHTVWVEIYKKLIGWNPYPNLPVNITSFTYAEGGPMGLANGELFWIDRWRIGFPTTNVVSF